MLAQPAGPGGLYDRYLLLLRRAIAEPLEDIDSDALLDADTALAAVATLRNAAEAATFARELREPAERIAALLQTVRADIMVISLLALVAEAATVGEVITVPPFDVDRVFDGFLINKNIGPLDKATAALVALERDRLDDIDHYYSQPRNLGADVQRLVIAIRDALADPAKRDAVAPEWDRFLRGFPASLAAKRARWPHLLVAARLIWSKLGDTPVADVASKLHDTVVALAAEPAT